MAYNIGSQMRRSGKREHLAVAIYISTT